MDMGETLRHAREQRGLSLDELSRRTKISPVALRAIETNDIQRLPGGIFLRGFLRSYAREVGLNAEDTVSRYVAQFESLSGSAGDSLPDLNVLEVPIGHAEPPTGDEPARRVPILALAAAIVLSLGGLAYMTLRERSTTSETASAPAVRNAVALAAPSVPAAAADETVVTNAATTGSEAATIGGEALSAGAATATAGIQEPSPAATPAGDTLVITIQTTGPCWVSAVVDGRTAIYRLMQADEMETLEGGTDVMLLVGDAATFTFQVNGAAGKPLGAAGEVATVHITNDNYQRFLESPASEPPPAPAQ